MRKTAHNQFIFFLTRAINIFTKIALLVISLSFYTLNAQISAQTISLSGKIFDKTSKEELPGASIALYHQRDSVLIDGTVSDSSGLFIIKSIPKGAFFLEISFIGFVSDTIANIILSENKDIGLIGLEPSSLLLDEISATAEKSIMTNQLDKKVYHVDQDMLSETSSAREILQNIPSVTVDIGGGITLRNTSNITFFLNGRPSALFRRNASSVLEQLPANSIERIEIITNPSAKYRPDGVGGIINIVLKKDAGKGMNGQISAHMGNEERYNASVNLNYGTEDLNIFGNYGIRHSNGSILYTDERLYKDSIGDNINTYYNENGNSKTDALSHNVFAGINYDLNDFNSMEFSGTYFLQNSFHDGKAEINTLDSLGNPDYSITNRQTNDEIEEEGELNFAFEHAFKNNEDHTLSFEATYAAYDEKEDKVFNQTYTFPTDYLETSKYLIQKSGNQQEIILDYALPIGEDIEFESGYAGEFIHDDIRYDNKSEKSRFQFNQEIHALYATFGQSIEDFSYKAGLRAEQTFINSYLKIPSDTLIPNNYFKIFPTIHLSYDLSETKQLSLSYSKRLNRPDPDELNPYPEFSDPRNAEAGNPNLKPEQIHSVELGYQYSNEMFSISSSVYYRYKYDAFTAIFENIGDSIVLYTTTNLNTRQSGGLEAVLSGKFSTFWTYSLTLDVFYTTIDATNLGYGNNKSSISGNIKAYSLFKLTKSSYLQCNAYYYFPSITPQGKRERFYYFNMGLKQNLFKNKASITLTGTDIFHTYKINYNIESTELNQKTSIQRLQPVVYFGFIWRFNNYKDKEKIEYEGEGLVK